MTTYFYFTRAISTRRIQISLILQYCPANVVFTFLFLSTTKRALHYLNPRAVAGSHSPLIVWNLHWEILNNANGRSFIKKIVMSPNKLFWIYKYKTTLLMNTFQLCSTLMRCHLNIQPDFNIFTKLTFIVFFSFNYSSTTIISGRELLGAIRTLWSIHFETASQETFSISSLGLLQLLWV